MSQIMSQTEKYVDSRTAIEMLGEENGGRFFYYVKSGEIAKEPESPKRNARYSTTDILKVKEKLANKKRTKPATAIIVDWIGVDDVLTSLQLDYRVYGSEVFLADLPYYAERVKRNPRVALAVFESPKRERILAYISLLPLSEQTILEILREERHETTIRTEEIETYEREGSYTLLAESVVTDPDHSEQLNTLLRHLTEYWCEQYPERYISKIYAQAESKQGDILIQKLFFAPLEDVAPNAYMLNMQRPGASRFIRRFQECIEQKNSVSPLLQAMKGQQTRKQEPEVDSKTDSKTSGKHRTTVDIGGQSGTKRKTPNRFTSRSTKVQ
ncbi:MAG TPA: hypothetical protein VNG51_28270 [Ktedonobacteraceae bacterium]|nr:hypothetical protein [Ktedonobacteraceae bacterium]